MKEKKLTRCVLYQEYFDLLWNAKDAMVLWQMVYWQSRVYDFDLYQKEINIKNINHWLEEVDLQKWWMYKSNSELANEVKIAKEDAIWKSLNRLVELWFLQKRRNPKYKRDRTNQYRVNVLYLYSELNKLNYSIPNYDYSIPINEDTIPIKSVSTPTISGAIPETTTYTTTDTTTKEKYKKEIVEDTDALTIIEDKEKKTAFESVWKAFPHPRTSNKKISLANYMWNTYSADEILKEISLLNIEYAYGLADIKYWKAFERWIRDVTVSSDVVYRSRIREIVFKQMFLPTEKKIQMRDYLNMIPRELVQEFSSEWKEKHWQKITFNLK